MKDEAKDDCLQELERLNKEIETVRHEVEQEQRRLSRYQTVQADGRDDAPKSTVSKPETAGKNVDVSYGLSSGTDFTKTYSRARKYVVDNSKPRTDLEYDPLSNFSAGLRSYSSTCKEQKVKNGQGLKRTRNAASSDQKKPVAYRAQVSSSPSSEPLDDSNEDGDLIIDIPPSPDKTVEENRVYSNSQGPSNLYENKECEKIPVNESVVDLTGCLEDLGSESQAAETVVETGPEPVSPRATTDRQDQNWNSLVAEKKEENKFQVELPQCELPDSVEKMNPLQPHHFHQRIHFFIKLLLLTQTHHAGKSPSKPRRKSSQLRTE